MSRVGSTALQNPPSLIEHGKLRFMIMDSPTGQRRLQPSAAALRASRLGM
tara:strand:+ start:397 stop:546 length:150 start_codon:yes stop_codon:yes gene_type:complete